MFGPSAKTALSGILVLGVARFAGFGGAAVLLSEGPGTGSGIWGLDLSLTCFFSTLFFIRLGLPPKRPLVRLFSALTILLQ